MKLKDLLAFIKANPGATSKDVALKFNITVTSSANRLYMSWKRKEITRVVKDMMYSYYIAKSEPVTVTPESFKAPEPTVIATKTLTLKDSKPTLESMVSSFASTFAKSIAEAIVEQLKPRLEEELKILLPTALPLVSPKEPKQPEVKIVRTSLPKIGICGLLPQQFAIIKTEFQDTFDLSCWNEHSGSGTGSLKAMGGSCEAVFIHTNHISHNVEEVLRTVRAKCVRVGGGMSSMRDALTKYYVEEVK